jgi:hypothetical protein
MNATCCLHKRYGGFALRAVWDLGKAGSVFLQANAPLDDGIGREPDPTGKSPSLPIGVCVQPSLQKFFHSLLRQITGISVAIPAHSEGRFAIVTDVGQGMQWTRHVKRRMTLRADGEVVWS